MRTFSILALAAFVSLTASGVRATGSVVIDDSTDNLTVSLDGTDLTSLLSGPTGPPPDYPVGTLRLNGGLLSTGPGCNNPGGAGECTVVRWIDDTVFTSLPEFGEYASPIVSLGETGGNSSDLVSMTIISAGISGTFFEVDFRSDGDPGFPAGACAGQGAVTGCVNLGLETGSFQDVTTALLTPVAGCSFCSLPTGVTNFSVSVKSDVEGTSVPEPATLALLSLGLAGLGFSRRKR